MEKFELVPRADGAYSVPREKSISADYIERYYECKKIAGTIPATAPNTAIGHRNTIYWEQPVNIVSLSYKTEEMRKGSSGLTKRRGDGESLFT
jgi:hypothetical protein